MKAAYYPSSLTKDEALMTIQHICQYFNTKKFFEAIFHKCLQFSISIISIFTAGINCLNDLFLHGALTLRVLVINICLNSCRNFIRLILFCKDLVLFIKNPNFTIYFTTSFDCKYESKICIIRLSLLLSLYKPATLRKIAILQQICCMKAKLYFCQASYCSFSPFQDLKVIKSLIRGEKTPKCNY
ncbi:unnamed protein product [Moneuplotes crassus]|uniref:Uncharacterized protein n=1 Tax=Euplotes crassus TaxID=5936 RepID=A0AAD1U3L8_EUPCR|nr:unnamed protein product [Moneuplotes crassus]